MKHLLLVLSLLLSSGSVYAATTVTVDDNSTVQVNTGQPQAVGAHEVAITHVDSAADFEGEIERIDRSTRVMDVIDTEGRTRQVLVRQDALEVYRTGDFVRIHPIAGEREVVFVREESNRDLEGRIINVDNSQSTITVKDAQGRDRRVKLKQGMISNYKVDDFVRIHLMADLKEAKMIRTIK